MVTRIQICTESQTGDGPIVYDGEFGEMDFINRDVIMGELIQNMLRTAQECDVINEDLNMSVDRGKKVVIKYWKENKKAR